MDGIVNWEWWSADSDKVIACDRCMEEKNLDVADLPDATLTGDPCSYCGYEPSE